MKPGNIQEVQVENGTMCFCSLILKEEKKSAMENEMMPMESQTMMPGNISEADGATLEAENSTMCLCHSMLKEAKRFAMENEMMNPGVQEMMKLESVPWEMNVS